MSVSFFPSVPYPDKIGVNMSYSSFGEVRQILAGLIDKEFADLIKEAYSEHFPSDFYTPSGCVTNWFHCFALKLETIGFKEQAQSKVMVRRKIENALFEGGIKL